MTTIIPEQNLTAGTRVKSHFRAAWTGVIVASGADFDFPDGQKYPTVWVTNEGKLTTEPTTERAKLSSWSLGRNQALVRVTHDRCGKPMRKPDLRIMGLGWLEALDP